MPFSNLFEEQKSCFHKSACPLEAGGKVYEKKEVLPKFIHLAKPL